MIVVDGDGRVRASDEPLVCADDLGLLHGDGVFETILVRDRQARLVEAHLARLADGAARLELPAPDPDRLRTAVATAAARWTGPGDGALRIVYTRGRESMPGPATAFVTVSPAPERAAVARRDGVSVTLLPRALDPDAVAPWELAEAKALSYARNTAAMRHARRLGFDDAIFVSSAGTVLESPRANVVTVTGEEITLVPPGDPILAGVTQAALAAQAQRAGIGVRYARTTPDDLAAADSVWLLSSLTLAARVTRIDDRVLSERLNSAVDVQKLVASAISTR